MFKFRSHVNKVIQISTNAVVFNRGYHVLQPANVSLLRNDSKQMSFINQTRHESSLGYPEFLAGFWKAVSNSAPVAVMQDGLVSIHDYLGIPWWGSIIVSTILFRTAITLPLAIYQNKVTARLENVGFEMKDIVESLKREAAMAKNKFNWTNEQTLVVFKRSMKKQWDHRIVRDNCHPAKTFVVLWAQIPLWICQSVALRNLVGMLPDPNVLEAKIIFTQMTLGGFLWIPNLTECDSSYILPVALGLTNLAIIEMQSMIRKRPSTRFQTVVTNIFRGLSLVMIPVASSVPSALCVYWVTSSAYGLAQNLLLLSPRLRRVVGIPKTPLELEAPYDLLKEKLQNRLTFKTKSFK